MTSLYILFSLRNIIQSKNIMNSIIYISLLLNIMVLIPVCCGIILQQDFVVYAWGFPQPSLYILVSIYCTILLASLYLLIKPNRYFIFSLLVMQITYKLLTPLLVGSLHNPVIISNLVISVVHLVSLYFIIQSKSFSLADSSF